MEQPDCAYIYPQAYYDGEWGDLACDHGQICACETVASTETPAPTPTEYWKVYWTSGADRESYVWVSEMSQFEARSSVLVDTTGYAQGVVVSSNTSTVYFTDNVGKSVWRVDDDGYDLVQLVDESAAGGAGEPLGIDLWEHAGTLYWADEGGEVRSSNLDGTDPTTVASTLHSPTDVAVDKGKGELYISDARGVYQVYVGEDAARFGQPSLAEWNGSPGAGVKGIAVDSNERVFYYCMDGAIMTNDLDLPAAASATALYTGVADPRDVVVDSAQDLVFFTSEVGVHYGSRVPGRQNFTTDVLATQTIVLFDVHYVAVHMETAPSPAPTPSPTGVPTAAPSATPSQRPPRSRRAPVPLPAAPVRAPIRGRRPCRCRPSALPTPHPSPLPTSTPSGSRRRSLPLRLRGPTAAPIRRRPPCPSGADLEPTPSPTSQPIPSPTSLPIPSPTSGPSPTPTAIPTPGPTFVPTPLPTSPPT